jgi:hypothetical protein
MMNNRHTLVQVQSVGEKIETLIAEFDPQYKMWMSSHNIRQWVQRALAKGISPNACSNFGYGYETVSDFDSVPWRWLTDERLKEIDERLKEIDE